MSPQIEAFHFGEETGEDMLGGYMHLHLLQVQKM
jgi:hypothetical protein